MYATQIRDDDDASLEWAEVDDPRPGPGEVVVDVHATAVNRADLLQRKGLYPPPKGASEILGLEAAGAVAALGEGVHGWSVGDRVACLLAGGGYAEKVAVPADHLLALPDAMSFEEAAAIPEVFYTAYLNLRLEAGLEEGEEVLIHAAASGVGTAAIQLCRLWGCPVIGTASEAKLARLAELGVDRAVDRRAEDFEGIVAERTEGRGVDVILDPVGGDYLPRNVRSLASRGRLVVIGLLGGASGELPLGLLLRKRLRVIGSVLRSRSNAEKAEITRRFRQEVWPHFAEGTLEPTIDEVYPIEAAHEAHARMKRNETFGKLVLRVRS